MIPAILSKLAGPIVGPVALLGCVFLASLLLLSSCENGRLEKQVARARQDAMQARQDLGTCKRNREVLSDSLDVQNAAVDAWRKAGADVARDLKKAGEEARQSMLGASNRVATIMAHKPSGGDACVRALEADKLIEEFAR
jgi:ABC-type protease/lipase transport system fused ATPase/permease subunit